MRVRLSLRANLAYRPVAIGLVGAIADAVPGSTITFRNDVVTAFGEAFNNVAIHGYGTALDGPLEVDAEIAPGRLELHVVDYGRAIDFARLSQPDFDALPESGMGIFMIYALLDSVSYSSGDRNVLTLVKCLATPSSALTANTNPNTSTTEERLR